jgi:hypothetical protein
MRQGLVAGIAVELVGTLVTESSRGEGIFCERQHSEEDVVFSRMTCIMDNTMWMLLLKVVDRQESLSSITEVCVLHMNMNRQHFSGDVVHFYFPIFGTQLNSY